MAATWMRQAVKAAAAAVDVVRRPAPGIVVLIYHRVGGHSGMEVDLPVGEFATQIEWLAGTCRVLSLDDALAELASPGAVTGARPTVALTFDDGTADFADLALPILVRHQVPATLYVATAFVEEQRPFPQDGLPLSWDALADAVATGLVTVGSHTHSHALLDRIPTQVAAEELDRSLDLVGARLGVRAEHFAYPKALGPGPGTAGVVRARFRSAALAGGRPNRPGATDPWALARTPVQRSDTPPWFRRKARGGLAFEDTIRRRLAGRRYTDATT